MTKRPKIVKDAPPDIAVHNMTKRFGSLVALDDVSIHFKPGTVHALLGENGAGKSTLVKCMMGYYHADEGTISVDGVERQIGNTRDAHRFGLGMVYQHFTLVPSMSVAENLVLGEEGLPSIINWKAKLNALEAFMETMPFGLELDRIAQSLAAGEKQKLEILKQLYLGGRFLILDEPTSVLTPDEADEVLGLMRKMADDGRISILLITHKLREVEAYASEVSVLRHGLLAGTGKVSRTSKTRLINWMIGQETVSEPAARRSTRMARTVLEVADLIVNNDKGTVAVEGASLSVGAGEILGIAGVSGNGQSEFVETLAGQREEEAGEIRVQGYPYTRTRAEMADWHVHLLPEEPLHNACVREMTVAENLALRNFDRRPNCRAGNFIDRGAIRNQARKLIAKFNIKTQGPDARIETLSGGNIQRTVLARELSDNVQLLIVQNPCFGLDLKAVAEIRNRIMEARNAGAAVLLFSEDLDEILELSDRIAVMFEGQLVYETPADKADIHTIGRYMASHG